MAAPPPAQNWCACLLTREGGGWQLKGAWEGGVEAVGVVRARGACLGAGG